MYVALGNTMTAAKAFAALALFNVIEFPLTMLPHMLSEAVDMMVTGRRLSKCASLLDSHTTLRYEWDALSHCIT